MNQLHLATGGKGILCAEEGESSQVAKVEKQGPMIGKS